MKKTLIVPINTKYDITSFVDYIKENNSGLDIVFTNVKTPCESDDDSILALGDVLSVYAQNESESNNIVGCYKFTDNLLSSWWFKCIEKPVDIINKYGILPYDLNDIAIRTVLSVVVAKIYDGEIFLNYDMSYSPVSRFVKYIKEYVSKYEVKVLEYPYNSSDDSTDTAVTGFMEAYSLNKDEFTFKENYVFESLDVDIDTISKIENYCRHHLFPILDDMYSELMSVNILE